MATIPNPQVVPLVDKSTGKITREWLALLQSITTTATTADLTALSATVATLVAANTALSATVAALVASDGGSQSAATEQAAFLAEQLMGELRNLPAVVPALESPIDSSSVAARVDALEQAVNGLSQGVQL